MIEIVPLGHWRGVDDQRKRRLLERTVEPAEHVAQNLRQRPALVQRRRPRTTPRGVAAESTFRTDCAMQTAPAPTSPVSARSPGGRPLPPGGGCRRRGTAPWRRSGPARRPTRPALSRGTTGQRQQLRVAVRQRGARRRAVGLEHHEAAEAHVAPQILRAFAERPQHARDAVVVQACERVLVARRLRSQPRARRRRLSCRRDLRPAGRAPSPRGPSAPGWVRARVRQPGPFGPPAERSTHSSGGVSASCPSHSGQWGSGTCRTVSR